jgi:hypothetical protein
MRGKQTINKIEQVKVEEAMFCTDIFKDLYTWHIELDLESIVVYFTVIGSKKKYNKSVAQVSYKEMEKFFSELYDFARSAEDCLEEIDDVGRSVTFVYVPGTHKEIFNGCVHKGDEEMISKIVCFIDNHGVTNYWDMEGYEEMLREKMASFEEGLEEH